MALGEYLGAGASITQGLYHLNGDATDSSGNGNNGTATNVSWVAGRNGSGAASFNHVSSKITTNSHPLNGATITCSFWINNTYISTDGIIAGETNNATNAINRIGVRVTTGDINYVYTTGLTGTIQVITATNISDGKWHNIVLTRNNNVCTFYVDGNFSSTATMSNTYSDTNTFTIGDVNYALWFGGVLDEMIFDNRVWTPSEIQKQYAHSKGRFGIL